MNNVLVKAIFVIFLFINPFDLLYADHEKEVTPEVAKARELLIALYQLDFDLFKQLIDSGADPLLPPSDRYGFQYTSMCQSTQPDREAFLDYLLSDNVDVNVGHIFRPKFAEFHGSALACAIHFENTKAFDKIVAWGVGINDLLNPQAEQEMFYRTPLEIALIRRKFKIAAHIVSRIGANDKQIKVLVSILGRNGGIEGKPDQVYRRELVQWLRSRGHEVNPKPPAPKELYEIKK